MVGWIVVVDMLITHLQRAEASQKGEHPGTVVPGSGHYYPLTRTVINRRPNTGD